MSEIPRDEWKWFGSAAHLIVAQDCRFHLATLVGPWLVSTVGEYLPDAPVREILAERRGMTLEGIGDYRRASYMKQVGFEEIGAGRKYETMVFRAGEPCTSEDCSCGLPSAADWMELDANGYNDAGAATAGHYAICEKWAALPVESARAAVEEK